MTTELQPLIANLYFDEDVDAQPAQQMPAM